jgi:hypothetical protein
VVRDREDFLLVIPRVGHLVIGSGSNPDFTPFFRYLRAAIARGLDREKGPVYLGIRAR